MKRIRPAPMGRAFRYQRRHVAHRDFGGRARGAAVGLVTTRGEPAAKKAAAEEGAAKKAARRSRRQRRRPLKKNAREEGLQLPSKGNRRIANARRSRSEEKVWDRKSILTDFGSA